MRSFKGVVIEIVDTLLTGSDRTMDQRALNKLPITESIAIDLVSAASASIIVSPVGMMISFENR